MARLNWQAAGSHQFEAGIDHGVLYIGNGAGVPWIGLVAVNESYSGVEVKSRYLDRVKITSGHFPEEFEATIEAYTYPTEFEACDGTVNIGRGLRVKQQRRQSFGMSYRTLVGDELQGLELGYKIHILYNLLAEPSKKESRTLGISAEAGLFSWHVTSRAPLVEGFMPSAHFVIDSREVPEELWIQVEDILYGSDQEAPRLPSAAELIFLFQSFETTTYDAGDPYDPVFVTYDAGAPDDPFTTTIDGGAL